MHIPDNYELLDSGGRKLERFGPVILSRPCAQAVWEPARPELWDSASASFDRKDGLNWHGRERLPEASLAFDTLYAEGQRHYYSDRKSVV